MVAHLQLINAVVSVYGVNVHVVEPKTVMVPMMKMATAKAEAMMVQIIRNRAIVVSVHVDDSVAVVALAVVAALEVVVVKSLAMVNRVMPMNLAKEMMAATMEVDEMVTTEIETEVAVAVSIVEISAEAVAVVVVDVARATLKVVAKVMVKIKITVTMVHDKDVVAIHVSDVIADQIHLVMIR